MKQRYMHPPVLVYAPAAGSAKYRCVVKWQGGQDAMELATPEFDLAGIWQKLPAAGPFRVEVEAVDAQGKTLANVGGDCQRIADFKGPYRPAARGYDEAGAKTVGWLIKQGEGAGTRGFGANFRSSYVRLLTSYVRFNPKGELAEKALALAKVHGVALLKASTPGDWVYANMPLSHDSDQSLQIGSSARGGLCYFELYDVTQDKSWLDAAGRIGDTLKKTQLSYGRWPWRVEPRTGKTLSDYTSDQVFAIVLLDELASRRGRQDLIETRDRAVAWMLANPCKTFRWEGLFEDVGDQPPFSNLHFFDTMWFVEHLMRYATAGNGYEKIALEQMLYAEDQFVEWEPTGNYVTPGCREQYVCYHVIAGHAANYIRACLACHVRTRDDIWLKKARAMADTLTCIQHAQGFYGTFPTHEPTKEVPGGLRNLSYGDIWSNDTSYCGEMLLRLNEYMKTAGAKP